MADKDTLWTKVKADYSSKMLLPLVSIHDRAPTSIGATEDAVGTSACEDAIALWAMHCEVSFDVTDVGHLAVAAKGAVAILMERGGSGASAAAKAMDRVWGEAGLVSKIKRTEARDRQEPKTSGPDLGAGGEELRPYSHYKSLPVGFLPSSKGVLDDDD